MGGNRVLCFIARRVASAFLTVWITTVAVALLIHVVPGDPVQIMYSQSQATTPQQLDEIRKRLGLDRPVSEQYFIYLNNVVHGDFGKTIRGEQPVLPLLLARLPNTLLLTFASLLVSGTVGVSFGFIAAYRRGSVVDLGLMVGAIIGVSIPSFCLGLLLIFVFAVKLRYLPVSGSGWASLILPAMTLGLSNAAIIARLTRSAMIEILDQDFVRTAWAKGIPKSAVLLKHALRAALIPITTMLGLQFAYLMGGAVIVENVFAWNGIGRVAVQAIFQRDYPLIQGFILIFACVVVVASLLIDTLNAWLDPRVTAA